MNPLRRYRRAIAYCLSLLMLAVLVSPARAQVLPMGGGFAGGIISVALGIPNGTAANPGLYFSGDTNNGMYYISTDFWGLSAGSTGILGLAGTEVRIHQVGKLGFSSASGITGTDDAFWLREAAATIQMGADVNGAPTTQTYKAADGITGTDVVGSGLTLASGLGTGAGVSQPITINRQVTKATGTTAQTYAPAVIQCPTKILSNTSATTTTVATITTTSTTGGSVTMDYTVIANNGTLQDVDGGIVKVAWGNNAGTVTSTMAAVAVQADADASGTLAATPTRTDATNVVSIKLTPTWVTIVPTSVISVLSFTVHTVGDTVACQ